MTLVAGKDSVDDMKSEAFIICQEFLSGAWKDITISEFRFSTVSGGLSNSLYHCSLPEGTAVKNSKTPREVLLRIYGPLQDETNVIVAEAAIFMLLAERKLGPKLYGVFPKGRLEEFIPSRILKTKDYRLMYPTIARELGKIHALEVPIRKVPDFWPVFMEKWITHIESEPTLESTEIFQLLDVFKKERVWLWEEIKKSSSPVVYCHNDLQGGNILFRNDSPSEEDPRLMLIDFEFGTYNYRGFDLANQFCEWCFDYNTGEYPYFTFDFEKFPSTQEQTAYIRAYLGQLVAEGAGDPSSVEDEVQTILSEINLFSMAAHILWSLWSAKMTFGSAIDFAHREHGKTRMRAYWIFKERYLKNSLCNGKP